MAEPQNEPQRDDPPAKPVLAYSNLPQHKVAAADRVLRWIAAIGCAYLLFQVLKFDSFGYRTMFQVSLPARLGAFREIDDVANAAAARVVEGNLLVSASSEPQTVSILHPRAVYALWPRRLYAVEPDTIVLNSAQIGPATRPSDPAWLKQHDIRATVEFRRVGNRLTITRVDPVSPR